MVYLLDGVKKSKAKVGDFVAVELRGGDKKFKSAHVVQSYGQFDLNKATSSLILEKYDIPFKFDENVMNQTKKLDVFKEQVREDLTNLPLVTIDGEDAKDFDDAIWAEKTSKGYKLVVAIADVSFYVKENSEIDKEAYKRSNSVYLPNMVIPMLPEILSNGLCSLMPNEKRASVVCFMDIDLSGNIISYDFKRAVIKSAARLTYKEVQDAIDGNPNAQTEPLLKTVIMPIFDAFQIMDKARKKRGALELDVTELKVKVDKNGRVSSVEKYEHYTSHSIVEEFMIAANVAAAKALQKSGLPTMYRIHDKPSEEKLKDFTSVVEALGMKMPPLASLQPAHFNKVLVTCRKDGVALGISDIVLRSQSQAKYSPENIGHFGLALKDYVHFTSPIRRYSDLLVHRALVKAYKMPDGGALSDEFTEETFKDIAEHLCICERKAVSAERDLISRYISSYLEPSIGIDMDVKVVGAGAAGAFVRIETVGAEGLMPMSSLPDDNYTLLPGNMALSGDNTGLVFKIGDKIKARLIEASPITGGLIFKYIDDEFGVDYREKGSRFGGRKKSRR